MPEQFQSETAESSFKDLLRELFQSSGDLIKNEIALLKVQAKETSRELGKRGARLFLLAGVMTISILPILTGLVWGLGLLLDGRYWLSALIIGFSGVVLSGYFIYRTLQSMKFLTEKARVSRENFKAASTTVEQRPPEFQQALQGQLL